MALTVRRPPISGPSPQAPCEDQPASCQTSFGMIAARLDDLAEVMGSTNNKIDGLSQRLASQEQDTRGAWHQIRRIEESVNAIPERMDRSVARHARDCSGREYARAKLTAASTTSSAPRHHDEESTGAVQVARKRAEAFDAGLRLPPLSLGKLVLYVGAAIGAAVAGGLYLLYQLGVLGAGGAP